MKRAVDAYRKPKKQRPRKYDRAFVVAVRARWEKRDTYKRLADHLKMEPKELNYLLNAPLHVICKECESDAQPEIDSQNVQMTNGEANGAHP